MEQKEKTAALYFSEGSSDKVYAATLTQRDGGWVVNFSYGRRGRAQTTGTKTETPVDYAAADKIFEKLVREKTSKGYTPDSSGVAYTGTELANEASGLAPQLPTATSEAAVDALVEDPAFGLSEKRDGENRTLKIAADGSVRGINKRGLFVDIPQTWATVPVAAANCVVAGEHMAGDRFEAFDLLEDAGEDLRSLPHMVRHARLKALAARLETASWFVVLPLHWGADAKRAELNRLREAQAEGVVFKRLDAPFSSGRSAAALKFKFVDSATCIVARHNLQRSVAIALIGANGDLEDLGNVTIPPGEPIPPLDTLVEVRYLYRYEDGCFEQPVYLGVRTDVSRAEATAEQVLRIKRKAPAPEALAMA
jgi:bifunctional non-homologous end joining protein LigD